MDWCSCIRTIDWRAAYPYPTWAMHDAASTWLARQVGVAPFRCVAMQGPFQLASCTTLRKA